MPAGFGLQGVLSIVNANLNTLGKPLHASAIILVQMVVLGLPAVYLGKELHGIEGIFVGIATMYAPGGVVAWLTNRWVLARY